MDFGDVAFCVVGLVLTIVALCNRRNPDRRWSHVFVVIGIILLCRGGHDLLVYLCNFRNEESILASLGFGLLGAIIALYLTTEKNTADKMRWEVFKASLVGAGLIFSVISFDYIKGLGSDRFESRKELRAQQREVIKQFEKDWQSMHSAANDLALSLVGIRPGELRHRAPRDKTASDQLRYLEDHEKKLALSYRRVEDQFSELLSYIPASQPGLRSALKDASFKSFFLFYPHDQLVNEHPGRIIDAYSSGLGNLNGWDVQAKMDAARDELKSLLFRIRTEDNLELPR